MSESKRDTVDICKMSLSTSESKWKLILQVVIDKFKESFIFPSKRSYYRIAFTKSLDPNVFTGYLKWPLNISDEDILEDSPDYVSAALFNPAQMCSVSFPAQKASRVFHVHPTQQHLHALVLWMSTLAGLLTPNIR